MLSDFERKVRQILLNDQIMRRISDLDDLEQRTGHSRQDIGVVITKLKRLPQSKGGLK
ncbi:MAG: hypothetical protein ABF868_08890 [Sporolactobacillus sp.]